MCLWPAEFRFEQSGLNELNNSRCKSKLILFDLPEATKNLLSPLFLFNAPFYRFSNQCSVQLRTQPPRPSICAVAISSSNNAIDTRPDTENGSSTARSEYFNSSEALTLLKLTWPIVQPEKQRSVTSS